MRQFVWTALATAALLAGKSMSRAEFIPEPGVFDGVPADCWEKELIDPPPDEFLPQDEFIWPDDIYVWDDITYPEEGYVGEDGEPYIEIVPEYFDDPDADGLPSDVEEWEPDPGEIPPPLPCDHSEDLPPPDGEYEYEIYFMAAAGPEQDDWHNPEPATLVLFALGLLGLGRWLR